LRKKKDNEILHIRIHNPNTPDETAQYLVKIIATAITDEVINQKYQKECG